MYKNKKDLWKKLIIFFQIQKKLIKQGKMGFLSLIIIPMRQD